MTDAEFNKFVLMLENEAFRFSRSQNEFKEHRVVIECLNVQTNYRRQEYEYTRLL